MQLDPQIKAYIDNRFVVEHSDPLDEYERGFLDAVESMALALQCEGASTATLIHAINTVADAYENNAD